MPLYDVRYTIIYSDGQKSNSGSALNLDSPSESLAIYTLKRQNNVPQNSTVIINSMQRIGG